MMAYGWIITVDRIEPGEDSSVGVIGPAGCVFTDVQIKADGIPFRMFDDDGELYYVGQIILDESDGTGFEPIDDYGKPNAGCTMIQYRTTPKGKIGTSGPWATL